MSAETPAKTVEARVSISTDTRAEGRYFVDVRDTTGGRNRQMTTRVTDTPAAFVAELTAAGLKAGVFVEMVDQTGE
jgi:hypothetical protein